MKIYQEISLSNFEPWSGAVYMFEKLCNLDKIDELENILEELYPNGMDETELNDFLWFEDDYICELLGIRTEEEISADIREVQSNMEELRERYAEECEELRELHDGLTFGELEAKRGELWAEEYADDFMELAEQLEELEEELGK